MAAFHATLEELEGASLLVHVTDASHPQREQQDAAVEALLETLGIGSAPRIHVWNKIDLLDGAEVKRLPAGPNEVTASARGRDGLEELRHRIDHALGEDPIVEAQFDFPSSDGQRLALLYRCGEVLSTEYEDDRVRVRARVTESLRGRLQLPASTRTPA